jgi:DNA-binding transcriptional ArsR family regulator
VPAERALTAAAPLVASPLRPKGLRNLETVLKAVAHRHRLAILHKLAHLPEVAAGAFAVELGLTQPQASYHLQQLVNAGLIERYRSQQWMVYRLADGALDRLAFLLQGSAELDESRSQMDGILVPVNRRARV